MQVFVRLQVQGAQGFAAYFATQDDCWLVHVYVLALPQCERCTCATMCV